MTWPEQGAPAPEQPEADSGAPPRHAVSRRALLIGAGIAVAAVSVGVPTGMWLSSRGGTLVPAMLRAHPFTIAHRGGSADWPEMSAFAYEQAVNARVDTLEMSVGRSSDGVWFGLHDTTLDRTSGTTGFTAAEHTWAEIAEHLISPPSLHPDQPSRPYLRFEDFVASYRASHALWIDPKAVDPAFYPELLDLMVDLADAPAEVFVGKSDAGNTAWGELARGRGLQTWGFYYGDQLSEDPGLFARTQAPWTMLGLNWDAAAEHWQAFVDDGRPVVAHVLASEVQRQRSIALGAQGLMIAGISEIFR